MKKKLLLLILPLIFGLAGCGGNNEPTMTDKEAAEKAVDAFPMLLDFSSGKEVNAVSTKIEAPDYSSYLGLNTLVWKGKDFDFQWTAAPAEKWSVKTYVTDPARTKFMPLYGEEEFDCSLTLVLGVKGTADENKVTRTWNFVAGTHEKPDLTGYNKISLKTLVDEYMTSPTSHSGDKVYTFGTIVGSMEPNETHVYSGAFIQDGTYGLMLYAGNLSKIWMSVGFEIGDKVMIAGTTSPYMGLLEVKPTYIEYANQYPEDEALLADPVLNDLTDANWTYTEVGKYQNALVKLDDLTYVRVNKALSISSHGELIFKNKLNQEITLYCNYHLGSTVINQLIQLSSKFVPNVTKIDFNGIMSVYTNPQIVPVFGLNSITVK